MCRLSRVTVRSSFSLFRTRRDETKRFFSRAGFNYEAIDCLDNDTTKRYKLHIFDLREQNFRCVWEHFYNNMNVDVLATVDASDRSMSKLEKVRNVLACCVMRKR